MTHNATLLASWTAAGPEIARENLVTRRDLSISGFYVPAGQRLSFAATPGIDRLHILLRGRCRLIQGGTQLLVESGHALGIGAPGAHVLEAEDKGLAFFTLALRRSEDGEDTGGGLTILDVLGPGRTSARQRLEEWGQRPAVRGRLSILPMEQLPPGPVQIFPASERIFVVLEGVMRLETPTGVHSFGASSVHELEPDVPHRVLSPEDARTTVLILSDPEPAGAMVTHFSCGHRARFCDLVRHSGEGMLHISSDGNLIDVNVPAARWLGLPDVTVRGPLRGRLLPRDAQWLDAQLTRPELGGPARTVWASPSMEDVALSVLLVPYQGDARLSSALVYLRPMVSPPESGAARPTPDTNAAGPELSELVAQSPRMVDLVRHLPRLAADMSWVVVWGEDGTGRSTIARLLHRLGPGASQPFRALDCRQAGADAIEPLLFRAGTGDAHARLEPGAWLQGLNAGTLLLERFYTLPLTLQNRLLRGLGELKETGRVKGRVVVELDHRVQKGLPSVMAGSRLPRRGAFVTFGLPPLRERREDIPLLLKAFLERARPLGSSPPTLSGDALEALLSHAFPQNLHDVERLARALAASPLEGVISGAVIRPLLGKRRHEALFGEEEDVPSLAVAERALLLKALRRTAGNKAETARLLGITRTRLYRMLAEHHIDVG